MATTSEVDVDPIKTKTRWMRSYERSVTPSLLRALGLMRITSAKTTVTGVPLSESRVTKTDKKAGGSHTSSSKKRPQKKRSQSKSVTAKKTLVTSAKTTVTSVPLSESRVTETDEKAGGSHTSSSKKRSQSKTVTAKKTLVVKKERVSKPKNRAKKRSYEESYDAIQSIPAASDNPKKKEHASPATTVSSSAPKSTDENAENLSEITSAADQLSFWKDILDSDFKSTNYTMYLKNSGFTDEQAQAIQREFNLMSRKFCRGLRKIQPCMKTHACVECNFSISHECTSIHIAQFWNLGSNAPWIHYITPESMNMCDCDFSICHSHIIEETKTKRGRQARKRQPSPLPSTTPLLENNQSVNFNCTRCGMKIIIANRNNKVCSKLYGKISTDTNLLKMYYYYIHKNLVHTPQTAPIIFEIFSCNNGCCLIYHRCPKDVVNRKCYPIQTPPTITFLRT
ncbi:uncharacterized protein LOC110996954 [Pieris rapae]|uniref:uncharacterized protein LOC110996954 n=1 Tax=Pieris rapae TaxID=64459 RepID=UPI000B92ACB9|nr:uncharacterized protein LOC110996954 [Pieris rapae]